MTLIDSIKIGGPYIALVAIGAFVTAYAGGGGELFITALVTVLVAWFAIPLTIFYSNK